MQTQRIAVLGGGNMGSALIGGLLRRGMRPEQISVGESSAETRSALARNFGVVTTVDNLTAVAGADLVIVAVKPSDVAGALKPLASTFQQTRPVVVSVAGGIRTQALESWCGPNIPVVRTMPNRPAFVGAGVTALFAGTSVSDGHRERADETMRAVGEVVWVADEAALDVVTALSGSGPAYYFLLTDHMIEAAVQLGLEREVAKKLAIGTLWGSGMLAHEGDGDIRRMRSEVISKGGTTEAALRILGSADWREAVTQALQAAARRSREMSAEFGNSAQ